MLWSCRSPTSITQTKCPQIKPSYPRMSTEATSKKSLDLYFDMITDLSDGLEAMKEDKQDFLPVEGEAEPAWEQELLEKVSNSLLES